jgi:hypothetical protein
LAWIGSLCYGQRRRGVARENAILWLLNWLKRRIFAFFRPKIR